VGGDLEVQEARAGFGLDHRQAGAAEHAGHRRVARVHRRDEAIDAVAPCGLRELGEQDRCDAEPAMLLVDLEGDLRREESAISIGMSVSHFERFVQAEIKLSPQGS
jgi:hypothetical protein